MKELQDIDLKALIEAETGDHFNKDNKICSPFTNEKTPSFSVFFNSNRNKWQFKDFSGSNKYGDAIDFIMEYKNLGHKEARECLGLEVTKSPSEDFKDLISVYVSNQIKNGNKKGYKPLGTFIFVDKDNNPIYAKVKFLKPDKKKETPYYSINDGQVINKRLYEEVPYNYYNLLQGIAQNKTIVFLEGEKDVNTINNTLSKRDFVATSIKGFKEYDKIKGEFMKIAVIGDTGPAGEKYIDNIKSNFLNDSSSFKIINLPSIKSMGDNKDVTDWLEVGHTKKELLKAFDRSLDLKNKYELQQDSKGIYFTKFTKEDEETKATKIHITDFQLLEAKKVKEIDSDCDSIKIKLKSCIDGATSEKIGSSKIFDDLKSFRNFLGMDFSFIGNKMDSLIQFKMWINNYFAIDNELLYQGAKFLPIGDKLTFIGSEGAMNNESINYTIKAHKTSIGVIDVDKIETSELIEVKERIFKFLAPEKTLSIIGTIINDLAVQQNMANRMKLHHLLIIGESESGKSTILEKIIAPILNYPLETEKISLSSAKPWGFAGSLCMGNYPILCDEFKPSTWGLYKPKEICNTLRDAYDRTPIVKGEKSFEIRRFRPERPVIIAGEENYPNQEKAMITRSCIVYIAANERTDESSEAMFWLIKHESILNKLGRSLIDEILNITTEQYAEIQAKLLSRFEKDLKNRASETFLNVACGIEIFNLLLERHGLEKIQDYERHIIANIKEEILDGGEEAKSTIEQMLNLFNDMIADGRVPYYNQLIKDDRDGVYIRTSQVINEIFKFIKDYGSADVIPLKLRDFRKQATKSGYLIKTNKKQMKLDQSSGNPVWFDLYSKDKLQNLKVNSIVDPDLMEEMISRAEQKIIEGMFPGA